MEEQQQQEQQQGALPPQAVQPSQPLQDYMPAASVQPTKRGKRAKASDADESPQRAKKRALDRTAQRVLREKTKNHIAYLEETVEACRKNTTEEQVRQLLTMNATLYADAERLRKMLIDIGAIVQVSWPLGPAPAPPKGIPPYPKDDGKGSGDALTATLDGVALTECEAVPVDTTTSPKQIMPPPTLKENIQPPTVYAWNDEDQNNWSAVEGAPELEVSRAAISSDFVDDVSKKAFSPELNEVPGLTIHPHDDSPKNRPNLDYTSLQLHPLPHQSSILWQITVTVSSKILDISQDQALEARKFDDGQIFQAISQGWDTLGFEQQSNPITQILREYDEKMFRGLDQINRVAIAFKNQRLLRYFMDPSSSDLESLPYWQRPRQSRRHRQYPIGVDFFPWPALRDRFIQGETNIYSSTDFSLAFLRHFRFTWPFSFEDTFRYDPVTRRFSATPLFVRYNLDLKNWNMNRLFFQEFPDLERDILPVEDRPVEDRPVEDRSGEMLQTIGHSFSNHLQREVSGFRVSGGSPSDPCARGYDVVVPGQPFSDHWMFDLLNDIPIIC